MASLILLGTINWGVIGWVALGTVVFIVLVAALGRGIAAAFPPKPEHMSSFKKPSTVAKAPAVSAAVAPVARPLPTEISPEIIAVISASVAVVLRGQKFSVRGIRPEGVSAPNIERLMAEWSMEGRRQVYSSHQLR